MRNEHERNLNVLRGLLQACEDGTTEDLSDGCDGTEPWTEEDRRKSRDTADWLRATFFTAATQPAPSKSKARRAKGEQLFSDEQLWAELDGPDSDRRKCAVAAIDALAELASVRAKMRGTSFLVERQSVFDAAQLMADLRTTDRKLHDAAFRVWDEVSYLVALSEADRIPLTDELRQRARELREWALARAAELWPDASERDQSGEH